MPGSPLRVVLTGGIGTGKSTVAALLASAGATVVDADRIGHEVLEPGGTAFEPVTERWPHVVVDGRIDRRALGRIVFGDPDQLAELEALTHPAIRAAALERLADIDGLAVLEVPIPVRWAPEEWPVVVVDAPDEVRVARLSDRGLDDDEITQRMAAQPARDEWLAMADHVVDNSGGRDVLQREVDRLLTDLRY
ncbi:MAG: dephospho-CoA kinase [Acidimicrobiia bacterium]